MLAIVALYIVSAVTRRCSVFLYPAAWLFVQPGEALLVGIARQAGYPLSATAHPWLWALLGSGYLAAAFVVDRARGHYAKPLYLAGYALAVLPMVLFPISRLTLVQLGLLNLLIYGCSAWLAERERYSSVLWLAARLFPSTDAAGFRVMRTLFVYLLAWGFPLWLLAALSLGRPAPTMAVYGLALASLAPLYVVLGMRSYRLGRARRAGNLSHLPWYLGAYALSVVGPLLAAPDSTLRIVALALSMALYAASAVVSRRAGWLYPVAFLLPVLSWLVLDRWGIALRFHALGLLPAVAVSLAVAEALRRWLDGGASLRALSRRASWSLPLYAAVAAQAALISGGLAALGVAAIGSGADATVALWTALAYVALFLAGALIQQNEVTVWGSIAFGAAALEDGLRVMSVSWIEQPPRWALAAFVVALLALALRATRRDTAELWRRSLSVAASAVAGLALLVAVAGESALQNHAALQSLAATIAVSGLLLVAYGVRRGERLLGYAGVACIQIGYMLQLVLFDVGQPQAFVLPAGLYLLFMAYLERRHGAGMKALLEVAALTLLLGTSLAQAMGLAGAGAGRYVYDVSLLFESVVILGLGALLHWKRSLFAASASVVADVAILLSDPVRAMNTWYLMAIVGSAMIGAVVVIEQRRRRIPAWIDEWRLRLERWD